VSCAVLAVTAVAAPLPAGATTRAPAATGWKTYVFSVSYDGKGTFNYTAEGANGDTGCHMSDTNVGSYGFDQLWTVRIAFKSTGKGKYATEVKSVNHLSGPGLDNTGESHLTGAQTKLPDEDCADGTIVPNTGTYDCTSKTLTLTAYPKPQMDITRKGADLVFVARAFLGGVFKYSGKDSIPGDKKKCGTYDDDMTYGSDLAPGIFASTRVSISAGALVRLARKHSVKAPVGLNRNTDYPPQSECAAVFGTPKSCTLHKHSLSGQFQLTKVALP
jgi:hypothetical protein